MFQEGKCVTKANNEGLKCRFETFFCYLVSWLVVSDRLAITTQLSEYIIIIFSNIPALFFTAIKVS